MPSEEKRKKALAFVIRAIELHDALVDVARRVTEAGFKVYVGKPIIISNDVFQAARAAYLKSQRGKDA